MRVICVLAPVGAASPFGLRAAGAEVDDHRYREGMLHPRHMTAEDQEAEHHRARPEFNTWRRSA